MATQSHSGEQQWNSAQLTYVCGVIERSGVRKAETLEVAHAYPEILSAALLELATKEAEF